MLINQQTQSLIYDGTFDGFLTCVFEVYQLKLTDVQIIRKDLYQPSLFGLSQEIITEVDKADRVWTSFKKKSSGKGSSRFYYAFLSEDIEIENNLLQYMQHAFSSSSPIDSDYAHPAVLKITQTSKSVGREKHRMEAFVRFRLSKDNIYFAAVEPDFNVLPLLIPHFKSRYADQKWIIYDLARNFGLFYDLEKVEIINLEFPEGFDPLKTTTEFFAEEELEFQTLWKNYFDSTNIPSRKNLRLHIQHVPKRYWKYLSEKHLQF